MTRLLQFFISIKKIFIAGFLKKFPSTKQWRHFFVVLSKKERVWFLLLLITFFASAIFLWFNFYFTHTTESPANSGIFKEGVVGQPKFINPLYLSTQDVDRDIVEILFSGLMKYNTQGELVNDLIKNYEIKDDGKTFEVYLKDKIFWHDGKPLTADDVIFTLNLLQDPQYQSPLRIKWAGIAAEKINDGGIRFKLPKKYSGFLENLTLKILPKHIFQDVAPKNLPWSLLSKDYLVGSGPFKLKKIDQDKSGYIKKLTLERNKFYFDKKPYLSQLVFNFYASPEELIKNAEISEIDGFSLTDSQYFEKSIKGFTLNSIELPRYFALFFNLKSAGLVSQKNFRQALGFATDQNEILQKVFMGKGKIANSPILSDFFNLKEPNNPNSSNSQKAGEILDQLGYKLNTSSGLRAKTTVQETNFFKSNLTVGSQGNEVKKLQECLAKDKAVYPEGEINSYFGVKTKAAVIRFQEKYASEILTPNALKKGTGDVKAATRVKLNTVCFDATPNQIDSLKITLTTSDKFPLPEIAEAIKEQWQRIGIEVEIQTNSLSDLQTNALGKREFDILLFGEALNSIPDPFPFWHSSQKDYPGLNISNYISKDADSLLEKSRETQDLQSAKANLEKFQDVLLQDIPAIFLVRPNYIYLTSFHLQKFNVQKITEPAKRFSDIEQWYVKTKRTWK